MCGHVCGLRNLIPGLSADALRTLEARPWKGNVRELENLVQRLVVMIDDDVIGASHLPPQITSAAVKTKDEDIEIPGDALTRLRAAGISLDAELQRYEFALLREAIDRAEGTKTKAAEMLVLNKDKMKYLCLKYGL